MKLGLKALSECRTRSFLICNPMAVYNRISFDLRCYARGLDYYSSDGLIYETICSSVNKLEKGALGSIRQRKELIGGRYDELDSAIVFREKYTG